MSSNNEYTLPQIVSDYVDGIIGGLEESNFFREHSIKDIYARKRFTELLMELYVSDPSLSDEEFFWTEDEFEVILEKIIVGSIIYELKDDGILNSYEDENTDETFFLTEKGKLLSKELKNNLN